jgi:hypothetical protein
MKKLSWIFCCIFIINSATAQNGYEKGNSTINIGISPVAYNFGYSYYSNIYRNYSHLTFPAISLGYQYGLHDFISIGGVLGYHGRKYVSEYDHIFGTDIYEDKYNYTLFAIVAEFHLINLLQQLNVDEASSFDNLDFYWGLGSGMLFYSWNEHDIWYQYNSKKGIYERKEKLDNHSRINAVFRSYLGLRYYFSNNIGVFLETGYATFGYFTVGVSLKF